MLITLNMTHNKKKNIAPIEHETARTKNGVKKCSRMPEQKDVKAATGIEIKHIFSKGLAMLSGAFVAFFIFRMLRRAVSVMLSPKEYPRASMPMNLGKITAPKIIIVEPKMLFMNDFISRPRPLRIAVEMLFRPIGIITQAKRAKSIPLVALS